jgi:hypothetical protein
MLGYTLPMTNVIGEAQRTSDTVPVTVLMAPSSARSRARKSHDFRAGMVLRDPLWAAPVMPVAAAMCSRVSHDRHDGRGDGRSRCSAASRAAWSNCQT